MSTAVVTPDPQVQTTPTPAGQQPVVPVQPRDDTGRFVAQPAPQPVVEQPQPVAQPAPDQPYAVETLDGGRVRVKFRDLPEIYEGTQAEILPKITEALYNTKKWAQSQRQPQPEPVQQPVAPPSPFADPAEETAASYVADLIAKKAGYSNAAEMFQTINRTTATSAEFEDQQAAISFMAANPNYNPTPENSEKLMNTIASNGFADVFQKGTQEQRLRLMNMAHAYNLVTKVYEPMPARAVPGNLPVNPPPPIPVSRSSPQTPGEVPQDLQLSINDSQAVMLEKIGKLKAMGLL